MRGANDLLKAVPLRCEKGMLSKPSQFASRVATKEEIIAALWLSSAAESGSIAIATTAAAAASQ
jgi:hypothetical protein